MSNEAKTLIERARALPPEDRIALVEDVLDSLDRAYPDIDKLWARAYQRGKHIAQVFGGKLTAPIGGHTVGHLACSDDAANARRVAPS